MINVSVKHPLIAQVGEKVRIDAKNIFVDPDTVVASVEIRPLASGDFYGVTEDKILDWVYESEAEITARVRITDDSETPVEKEVDVSFSIVSAETDKLFSTDPYLLEKEGELTHYIPEQYSSFNHVHREAQRLILEELKSRKLTDSSGDYLTKDSITHTKELRDWATNLALSLIFFDLSTNREDMFYEKYLRYDTAANVASNDKLFLTVTNQDGTESELDYFSKSAVINRR